MANSIKNIIHFHGLKKNNISIEEISKMIDRASIFSESYLEVFPLTDNLGIIRVWTRNSPPIDFLNRLSEKYNNNMMIVLTYTDEASWDKLEYYWDSEDKKIFVHFWDKNEDKHTYEEIV